MSSESAGETVFTQLDCALTAELRGQFAESARLERAIRDNPLLARL